MKHASTGTNYAILTKWVRVQHEKKPALKDGKYWKYADCRFEHIG